MESMTKVHQETMEPQAGSELFERLPEDILISIISMLSFKEATRTGVLSRKWKDLRTFYSGTMVFVPTMPSAFEKIFENQREYVANVNKILTSHRAQTVSALKIYQYYDLPYQFENDVDGWLMFAREMKVRELTLDLGYEFKGGWRYAFPPEDDKHFTSLRKLSLANVNVRGGVLDQIFISCPVLEVLELENMTHHGTFRASGPSLKELRILHCHSLRRVEVFAENLTFFGYYGHEIDIVFTNTKKLLDLYLAGSCIVGEAPVHPSILPQLHGLTLDADIGEPYSPIRPFGDFSKLTRLRLKIAADGKTEVLEYISLVKASPLLSFFAIHLGRYSCCPSPENFEMDKISDVMQERVGKSRHSNLKVVTFEGFLGCESETMLALCLAEYAVSLSKMIVFLGRHQVTGSYNPAPQLKPWTLEQVEKLKACLPGQVKFEAHDRFLGSKFSKGYRPYSNRSMVP